jgi:hypothetical protein
MHRYTSILWREVSFEVCIQSNEDGRRGESDKFSKFKQLYIYTYYLTTVTVNLTIAKEWSCVFLSFWLIVYNFTIHI